jgi:Ca2+/H+ antiporter, TMEM165/GDT1 family
MDWKLTATTFATVFVAELGDKTQLATFSFAAQGSKLSVFLGSAAALVLSAALAVLLAEGLAKLISPRTLTRIAGVAFLAVGAWTLWGTRGS